MASQKIFLTIIFALGLSFSFFLLYVELSTTKYSLLEKHEEFNPSVYVIGSSHVFAIKPSYVEERLYDNDLHFFKVKNFGKNSDTPSKRLLQLESIIQNKPELIVYGISFRDFGYLTSCTILPEYNKFDSVNTNFSIPSINNLELFDRYTGINPQLLTLQHIKNYLKEILKP